MEVDFQNIALLLNNLALEATTQAAYFQHLEARLTAWDSVLFPGWLFLRGGGDSNLRGRSVNSSLSGQAGPADLVEQRAVTNFQRARGSFAIPAIGFQNVQDDLPLEIVNCLTGYFLEMDLAFKRDFRSRVSMLSIQEFAENGVFGSEDYVPFNQILQLANIARP